MALVEHGLLFSGRNFGKFNMKPAANFRMQNCHRVCLNLCYLNWLFTLRIMTTNVKCSHQLAARCRVTSPLVTYHLPSYPRYPGILGTTDIDDIGLSLVGYHQWFCHLRGWNNVWLGLQGVVRGIRIDTTTHGHQHLSKDDIWYLVVLKHNRKRIGMRISIRIMSALSFSNNI